MTEPAPRDAADVDAFAILAHGTGSIDHEHARRAFGLDVSSDDEQFAQAVVRHVARGALPLLRDAAVGTVSSGPAPAPISDDPVATPRLSFILRLPTSAT